MQVQYSCNMAAIEFSRYAHLFAAFEIDHLVYSQPKNNIDKMYNDLSEVIKTAKRTIKNDNETNWVEIRDKVFKLGSNYRQALVWFENPDSLKKDISDYFLENSLEYLVNSSGEYVAERIFSRYLNSIDIHNPFIGIKELNFNSSELFKARGNIELILKYNIVIRIPFLVNTNFEATASSETRAFLSNSVNDNSINDIWKSKDYWWRGKFIISQEMKNIDYSVPDISGVHGALYSKPSLELYRVMSFDPFRKTNDLNQFSKVLLRHINIYSEKIQPLASINIENKSREQQVIDLKECNLTKNIIVIIPENTEEEKLIKMGNIVKKYQDDYDLVISLKRAYGDSDYD